MDTYLETRSFAEYLSTAVHEYLHLVSYDSEDRVWPRFMEEGMTEYLAVQAVSPYLSSAEDLGLIAYSEQVEWLDRAQQMIGLDPLLKLYFQDKTISNLKVTLEGSVSDFEYSDFERKGETLFYMGFEDVNARMELKHELLEMLVEPEIVENNE